MNKGKNEPTTFLPPNTKIGGLVKYVKDLENICVTTDQARYFYKKVEQKDIVTIKQGIEEDRLNKNDIDNEEEINSYHNILVNEFDMKNVITSQMEESSILSNVVHHIEYDRNPRYFYNLDVKALNQKNHRKIYDR